VSGVTLRSFHVSRAGGRPFAAEDKSTLQNFDKLLANAVVTGAAFGQFLEACSGRHPAGA